MGKKSYDAGKTFEDWFKSVCEMRGLVCVRIPNGCRTIVKAGRPRLVRCKTPFDWLISMKGRSACVDTKTFDRHFINYSDIDPDQLKALTETGASIPSGYVVWFRTINLVVFFSFDILGSIGKGESLQPEQGLILGTEANFKPAEIFGAWTGQTGQQSLPI